MSVIIEMMSYPVSISFTSLILSLLLDASIILFIINLSLVA